MLIYYFGSKEALIAEVVALANAQMADALENGADAEIGTAAELVRYAWQALAVSGARGATRSYLELCVLSASEPLQYLAAHERIREPWLEILRSALTEVRVPPPNVDGLACMILDTIDGRALPVLPVPPVHPGTAMTRDGGHHHYRASSLIRHRSPDRR